MRGPWLEGRQQELMLELEQLVLEQLVLVLAQLVLVLAQLLAHQQLREQCHQT